MLKQRMHKHSIVRLHYCGGDLRACPNSEAQLGLLAIIDREALEHKTSETAASSTSYRVEDHEALQACAIVGELTDAVEDKINNFLANSVVAACKIVGRILLASDQLLRVEKLAVCAGAYLIDNSRLQINHDTTRHMFASTCLTEECVKCIVASTNGLVTRHLAIRLNAVLKAEQLPTCITNLNTTLSEMEAKHFTHCWKWGVEIYLYVSAADWSRDVTELLA